MNSARKPGRILCPSTSPQSGWRRSARRKGIGPGEEAHANHDLNEGNRAHHREYRGRRWRKPATRGQERWWRWRRRRKEAGEGATLFETVFHRNGDRDCLNPDVFHGLVERFSGAQRDERRLGASTNPDAAVDQHRGATDQQRNVGSSQEAAGESGWGGIQQLLDDDDNFGRGIFDRASRGMATAGAARDLPG